MHEGRGMVGIGGCGLVTSVGLTASASAAAIRAGISNARETEFIDWSGEPIMGHAVPLEMRPGRPRLACLAALAIEEAVEDGALSSAEGLPLILCVAERGRPGRLDQLDGSLIGQIEAELGVRFAAEPHVVAEGRIGGLIGMQMARTLLVEGRADAVVLAGCDGFISWPTLSALEAERRLLTSTNSNGFMPGEAAGALLVTRLNESSRVACAGMGFARETATIASDLPLRGDGLARAIRAAAEDAACAVDAFDFRICDVAGEQYYFKEAALAMARLVRVSKDESDLWHPADCIGEVGAAVVPVAFALASMAGRQGDLPGPVALCHFSGDEGHRGAAFLLDPARP